MTSPFTIDLNEDQPPHHLIFCSKSSTEDASSSSSISYPIFINPPHEELSHYHTELQPLHHQREGNLYASHGGSWDYPAVLVKENKYGQKLSLCKKEDKSTTVDHGDHQRENSSSVKWMSSKMRLMQKMMSSDNNSSSMHKFEDEDIKRPSSPSQHDHNNNSSSKSVSNNSNNSIRVCSDCNTTKTPLWRSGPRGPKSLCNACGIRQRKARRALAAAQSSANGTIFAPAKSTKEQNKEKKTSNMSHLPFKKRCKFTAQSRGSRKKLCFEDLSSIILSKNSAFQQLFPQDEKEAAILLMALSYGLVHS